MSKGLLAVLAAMVLISGPVFAQQAGSFIGGLDIGLASATAELVDDPELLAGSGFSFGAEVRYTLLGNLSFGPFIRYYRFDSDLSVEVGHASVNMSQYGALGRLNLFNVEKGKIYIFGGGGLFEPNVHFWAPDYTYDYPFERGQFFTGGFGLCSNPYAATIYELEFRYNRGDADFESVNHKCDFYHISMRLMFNSKGIVPPPRY